MIISKTKTNKIIGEITTIKEIRDGPTNKTKTSAIKIRTSTEMLMTIDKMVHLDGITAGEVAVLITVILILICSVNRKIKGMGLKIMIKTKDIKTKGIKINISSISRTKIDTATSIISTINRIAIIINKETREESRSLILKTLSIRDKEIKLILMYLCQ